ncbi:MAG: hypothetical protein IJ571_08765 [Ruminococcus sp.]|nr:hypothetical protein [Ruminococcus sp.]
MSRISRIKQAGEYLNSKKDSDGRVTIDVNLPDDYEIYDPLSVGFGNKLNSEIYDYIERQANLIPASIPLKIRFHGRSFSEEEQQQIRRTIERHYAVEAIDKTWDKAANTKKLIVMAVFGIAMLLIYFYLSVASDKQLMTELFSVLGSFSLWEAAGSFLLERPDLKREYESIMQFKNQTIEFSEN